MTSLLRRITGQDRWDEASRYAPPPPGNGIGGNPCPCDRPHGLLYSDYACDLAHARAQTVRRHAIATSEERPAWLYGRLEDPAADALARASFDRIADPVRNAPA